MYRRRRKQRVQWMPPIGTELNATTSFDRSPSGRAFTFTGIGPGNPSATIETALTFDQPTILGLEQLGSINPGLIDAVTLSDWEMQSWRLRRIVGKMFIGASADDQQTTPPPALLLTAGIIVRTIDASNGNPVLSIGDQAVDTIDANQDPWVWRRQWILSTALPQGLSGDNDAVGEFPRTTAGYGSVQDGPHVDQKTNRVIGPQERLILNITCTMLPLPNPAGFTDTGHAFGYFDYRLLGGIMKASNRRNASR